ncbi:MAG: replication initiation protein [Betaproteobacteria bacterium]|nr:replication initiation protein [Betaproteobacteria bacterium]
MNLQLEQFYEHLNEAVITTNDFNDGTLFRKRAKVDQFAYCGLNPVYRSYLSFDIDHKGSAFQFDERNLPPPTIITVNPENSHCHYLYHLKTPVAYHDNSRSKPQEYFEAVQDALTERLDADRAFSHTLTKNPLNKRWRVLTFPTSYDLGDFLEYIELPKHVVKLSGKVEIRGRNDHLFHTLRYWSYTAVHRHHDVDGWHASVLAEATSINATFDIPLPYSEIRNTAKSVAGWVWKNRDNLGSRVKILEFTDESAKERMRLGAQYTNAKRTENAIEQLRAAHQRLIQRGENPTPLRLAAESGLNIKTIRKYLPDISID